MRFQRAVAALLPPVCLAAALMSVSLPAQQAPQVSPGLFSELRWRNIGPHRAGRTRAAAGHASQPYTFYIGR